MIGTEDSLMFFGFFLWKWGINELSNVGRYIEENGYRAQRPETFRPPALNHAWDMQPHLGLRAECTHPDLCAKSEPSLTIADRTTAAWLSRRSVLVV